jgi:methylenetetrahydrofolate dehydrogenase (NADP+)/methenyltetrahydrofolate cyclohydrolase
MHVGKNIKTEEIRMQNIKEYTEAKKNELRERLAGSSLKAVIVQVGNHEASNRYVRNKIKDLEEVGIATDLLKFSETISEEALLDYIQGLNENDSVTGYLVQLPLPKHISEEKVNLAIDPNKDIDGFHPLSRTIAATPLGAFTYLKDMNYDFSGKNAVIIGRSHIVGRPMHKLLLDANMNVVILHTKTSEEDKRFYLANADLIIVAAGKHGVIDSSYRLKESAVIMDVGINFNAEGKLIGDCEPGLDVAFQSPVPGGCGLLTRLAVIENLVFLAASSTSEEIV